MSIPLYGGAPERRKCAEGDVFEGWQKSKGYNGALEKASIRHARLVHADRRDSGTIPQGERRTRALFEEPPDLCVAFADYPSHAMHGHVSALIYHERHVQKGKARRSAFRLPFSLF